MSMRRRLACFLVSAVVLACDAFTAPRPCAAAPHRLGSASSDNDASPNLVAQDAFVEAIDVLKADMGLEVIPPEQRPLYAIGKLVAQLPLALVSGIRLADCESLTLISQVKQSVVDATGLQSLDTIVAMRAGRRDGDGDGGGDGVDRDTRGHGIEATAAAYTAAINYAVEHKLPDIELEVNRLVPLREAA